MVEPEWAAGWGTLALINLCLAQCKGLRGRDWFVGSLVFGPLATLALALKPVSRSAE